MVRRWPLTAEVKGWAPGNRGRACVACVIGRDAIGLRPAKVPGCETADGREGARQLTGRAVRDARVPATCRAGVMDLRALMTFDRSILRLLEYLRVVEIGSALKYLDRLIRHRRLEAVFR